MSICYEFALECRIKSNVSQEVIDTLKYMTRSQEYDFETPVIDHPLFKETSLRKTRTTQERRVLTFRKVTVIKFRQAANPKMLLDEYVSSVVARRDVMSAALEVGEWGRSSDEECTTEKARTMP